MNQRRRSLRLAMLLAGTLLAIAGLTWGYHSPTLLAQPTDDGYRFDIRNCERCDFFKAVRASVAAQSQ